MYYKPVSNYCIKTIFGTNLPVMLSVCIPVYNFDVRPLARVLSIQAQHAACPVEILFADDFSLQEYRNINCEITHLPHVNYREMPENKGRSAIRNYLTRAAVYPNILFLDADSMLPADDFIDKYAAIISDDTVYCGGTVYPELSPGQGSMLRWKYGKAREQLSPDQRQRKGFSITANNFLAPRELLIRYPFREAIREYGHEDTVFGYDIAMAGIAIQHIYNPVIHVGLEDSRTYLEKTRRALKNLLEISRNLIPDKEFTGHSGLLRLRRILCRFRLRRFFAWLFNQFRNALEKQLTGPSPRVIVFDLYKAGYICSVKPENTGKEA